MAARRRATRKASKKRRVTRKRTTRKASKKRRVTKKRVTTRKASKKRSVSKRRRVVKKKARRATDKRNGLDKWNKALMQARKNLGLTGFVACKKGTEFYKECIRLYK